jgi:hypothetical protein
VSSFIRGGLPQHINGTTANNAVEKWPVTGGRTNWLRFVNTSANAIVLTLTTEADATAGIGLSVAAGAAVEVFAEIIEFWTKAAAGASTFQMLVACRT